MACAPSEVSDQSGISSVWSESSLSAWRNVGSSATHWAHSEDSDQTGRMPRLICVFAGRTVILLVLSWGGSNDDLAGSLIVRVPLSLSCWWNKSMSLLNVSCWSWSELLLNKGLFMRQWVQLMSDICPCVEVCVCVCVCFVFVSCCIPPKPCIMCFIVLFWLLKKKKEKKKSGGEGGSSVSSVAQHLLNRLTRVFPKTNHRLWRKKKKKKKEKKKRSIGSSWSRVDHAHTITFVHYLKVRSGDLGR